MEITKKERKYLEEVAKESLQNDFVHNEWHEVELHIQNINYPFKNYNIKFEGKCTSTYYEDNTTGFGESEIDNIEIQDLLFWDEDQEEWREV